jgi:hypothetical protein
LLLPLDVLQTVTNFEALDVILGKTDSRCQKLTNLLMLKRYRHKSVKQNARVG